MTGIIRRIKDFGIMAKHAARRFIGQKNVPLAGALVLVIVVFSAWTKGASTTPANVIDTLLGCSVTGFAAMGQTFVMLSSGIDVSVGGAGLLLSTLSASLMTSNWQNIVGHPLPMYAGILVTLLAGVGWGATNGLAVSRIGMPALIVTLATWQIAKGLAFVVGGGRVISFLPDALAFWGMGSVAHLPVPFIIFVVIAAISYFVTEYTTFGRSIYAIGGNQPSAWLSGLNVKNTIFSVYVISGFLTGLSAVVSTARTMSVSMDSLAGLELKSIAAASVGGISLAGGRGSIIGAVIGTLIIGVINNGMILLGASPAVQGIVTGAIIFLAVALDTSRQRGRIYD